MVAPEGLPLAADCAAALTRAGAEARVVGPDEAAAGIGTADAVVSLLGLTPGGTADEPAVPAGLAATLDLVRTVVRSGADTTLWLVTSGAVAATPADRLPRPEQATLWGLGRTLALEHPKLYGGIVDLPDLPEEPDGTPDRLPAVLAATLDRLPAVLAGTEDQAALRATGVLVPRLARAPWPGAPRSGRGVPAAPCSSPTGSARWACRPPGGSPPTAPGPWC